MNSPFQSLSNISEHHQKTDRKTTSKTTNITNLKEITRFNTAEIKDLQKKFGKASKKTYKLNKENFREHLGVLGIDSVTFLSDRIFLMLDEDKDGTVNFQEFLKYLDVVLNGQEEEKATWTFRLIDCENKGYFVLQDFSTLIKLMVEAWIFWTGNQLSTPISQKVDQYIHDVFSQLDVEHSGKVSIGQFKKNWTKDPHFLEVCDFLNNGLHQAPNASPSIQRNKEKDLASIDKHYVQLYNEIDELAEKLEGVSYSLNNQAQLIHSSDELKKRTCISRATLHANLKGLRFENSLYVSPIQMDGDENNFGKDETASNEDIEEEVDNKMKGDDLHHGSFEFLNDLDEGKDNLEDVFKDYHQNMKDISLKLIEIKALSQLTHLEVKKALEGEKRVNSLKNSLAEGDQEKLKYIKEEYQFKSQLKTMKKTIPQLTTRKSFYEKKAMVFLCHDNWNLVLNMMLGIQTAVRSVFSIGTHEMVSTDFKFSYFFEIVPRRVKSAKDYFRTCIFYDFAPHVFDSIRNKFSITKESYLVSIGAEKVLSDLIKGNVNTLSELFTTGKSGSFFYYTADGKYTLKTIKKNEYQFLKSVLKNYYIHISDNPNSFINKIFGMHKIKYKMQGKLLAKSIYFIVMENIFFTNLEIDECYDLKGSLYKRETPENVNSKIPKKDKNALANNFRIHMSSEIYEAFILQLKRDCSFLENNNIIDYSFLIGVHKTDKKCSPLLRLNDLNPLKDNKIHFNRIIYSEKFERVYIIGIIDILTEYNLKKKTEYFFKSIIAGPTISAIPPKAYANRFKEFMIALLSPESSEKEFD